MRTLSLVGWIDSKRNRVLWAATVSLGVALSSAACGGDKTSDGATDLPEAGVNSDGPLATEGSETDSTSVVTDDGPQEGTVSGVDPDSGAISAEAGAVGSDPDSGSAPVATEAGIQDASVADSAAVGSPGDSSTALPDGAVFADAQVADAGGSVSLPADAGACAVACAAAGGVCAGETLCVFDCLEEGSCAEEIVCPDDFDCSVQCGDDACAERVTCPRMGAATCEVRCSGEESCGGGVECHAEECEVRCSGGGSCNGGISGGATSYNATCSGAGSCRGGVQCDATACNINCDGDGSCACEGNNCSSVRISANLGEVECDGAGSCNGNVSCSASTCDVECNTGAGACGDVDCSTGDGNGMCR